MVFSSSSLNSIRISWLRILLFSIMVQIVSFQSTGPVSAGKVRRKIRYWKRWKFSCSNSKQAFFSEINWTTWIKGSVKYLYRNPSSSNEINPHTMRHVWDSYDKGLHKRWGNHAIKEGFTCFRFALPAKLFYVIKQIISSTLKNRHDKGLYTFVFFCYWFNPGLLVLDAHTQYSGCFIE